MEPAQSGSKVIDELVKLGANACALIRKKEDSTKIPNGVKIVIGDLPALLASSNFAMSSPPNYPVHFIDIAWSDQQAAGARRGQCCKSMPAGSGVFGSGK